MALKAVIFDMDDTLVDWTGVIREQRQEVLRQHLCQLHSYVVNAGHILPELDEVGKLYIAVVTEMWDQFDGANDSPPRYIDMLAEMLNRLNVDIALLDLLELQNQVIGVLQPGVIAYPDARTVLEAIRNSGLLTGLLTNAPYPIQIRHVELETLNLMDLFDLRVTAEEIRYKKPNPLAFKIVLDRLGVKPEEAVYVGDLLYDDILGAQRAGMRAIWIRRRELPNEKGIQPDATIDQLTELLEILPNW